MRVAQVVSEVYPFSKTGGLADVAGALPAALARFGVETTLFTPYYRQAREWLARNRARTKETRLADAVWIGDVRRPVKVRVLEHDGRRFVFVVDDAFYDRASLYTDERGLDYEDNTARFAFLCRAALEFCLVTGEVPDLFHVHDWQGSLLPVYLKTTYRRPALSRMASVLTVHNLGYQGLFPAEHLYSTGLDWSVFHPEGLEFFGQLNLLKGGVVFADAVTTVSPSYAEEIKTVRFGCGLDGVLRAYGHKLTGILNGMDTERWDPRTDARLPACYGADDLSGKAVCKRELQRRMGLPQDGRVFLLGAVGRLVEEKGLPVLVEAFPSLEDLPVQLVVLGTGDREVEEQVDKLCGAWPARAACVIGFDEALAHLIEGGADAFVMPSAYEPCGLNQMYSQRYGTVPIVHSTGGLKDTVVDATPDSLATGQASGFRFAPLSVPALAEAIRRAERLYSGDPTTWRRLAGEIMKLDRGWSTSARAYRGLYEHVLSRAG